MRFEKLRRTLKSLPRWLLITLVLVLLLVLAGGLLFLRFQNQMMQREVERNLTVIAQLKVDQISAWRNDQIRDAELLAPLVAPSANRYFASSDAENEAALRTLLQNLADQHDYSDVLLVDLFGEVWWRLSEQGAHNREYLPELKEALQISEAVFLDLHRGVDRTIIHSSVVVPLVNQSDLIGALVLITNADQFLFPLIQSWPLPSESAETLLVRQEGDQVLFLNDLRYQPDAALELRFPLSRTDLPAVMGVQGVEGFVQGRDYRGAAVAAVLLPVPDSPWVIVSKVDAAEVFSEGQFRSLVILILMFGFIALFVVGTVAVQQRMEKLRYRDLHQSQTRQKALLESIYRNAPLVLMVVDGERRIQQVNGFAAQFAGRSAEEMLGLRGGQALRCLHALDSAEGCGFGSFCQECVVRNTVLDTLANGVTHLQVEASLPFMIEGQEQQLSFLLSTTPLGLGDGPLALVTMLDITERVQAKLRSERLLAQQRVINSLALTLGEILDLQTIYHTLRNHILELVDAHYFMISSYDESSKLIRAEYAESDRTHNVSNLSPTPLGEPNQDILSRVICNGEPFYIPDDQRSVTNSQHRFTIEADGSFHQEHTSENGREGTTRSAVYLPMKVQGNVIGVMQVQSQQSNAYTQVDINLLSGMANVAAVAVQNAHLIAELGGTIAERTAELKEKVEKLTQSERAMLYMIEDLNQITEDLKIERRKLELSNQELEAFAYSVSHDLRAPLRAINGFASFLDQDYAEVLDEDGQRFINVIQQSAMKMDRLISDLLDLSRVSRSEMRTIRVDMAEIARRVYQEVASEIELAEFKFEIQPLPMADCDPVLMERVWKNLIENALKYSAEAGIKQITIGGQTSDGETFYWIRDHGVGFNPQYQEKLFGVFQRLHNEEAYTGTGVGLAIVKRIIHRHGGRVWAEGELGRGATFYFTLPDGGKKTGKDWRPDYERIK